MDFFEIGDRIAARAFDNQDAEGIVFNASHQFPNLPNEVEGTAFGRLMAQIMGTAIAENVLGYGGQVIVPPNTGAGLDLEMPCCVYQVDPDTEEFITIWLKVGDGPTQWIDWIGSADTFKVKVDASDSAPAYLDQSVAEGPGTSLSVKTYNGKRKVEITATKVVARNGDGTVVGGLQEKTRFLAPLTAEVVTEGGVELLQVGLVQEPPGVVGSYLYPVMRVQRTDPVTAAQPTVTEEFTLEYAVTLEDISWHGHANRFEIATLPDEEDVYLVGFSLTVDEAFAGPDLTSLKIGITTQRNAVSYGIPFTGTVQLVPTEDTGTYNWELVGKSPGAEYEADASLCLQCKKYLSFIPGITCAFDSQGCLLDGLTSGSITLTAHYERRSHVNTQIFERLQFFVTYPGMGGGVDSTYVCSSDCPLELNERTVLTGLRITVAQKWEVYDVEGDIRLEIDNAQGQVVCSPFSIREKPVGTEWEFSNLRIPFGQQLRLIVTRNDVGTIGAISIGCLQIEYTVEQTTLGEVTPVDYPALTDYQESKEDTEPFEFDREITASSGETLMSQNFATLAGTPGVDTIPALPHYFRILGRIDYLGHVDFTKAHRWRVTVAVLRQGQSTPDAPYLTASGPYLYNTSDSVCEFVATPVDPPTIVAADTLVISVYAVTNSTNPVGFYLRQDTALSTWIRFPIAMGGSSGTLHHQQLEMVTRGFLEAQVAEAAANTHPYSSLYPNRPRVLDRTVATASGVLTVPTDCGRILRVSGTEPLTAIGSDDWDLLSPLTLVFTQGRDVQHGVGNLDTMQPENADTTITVRAKDDMHFYLDLVNGNKTWIRSTAR